MRYRCEATSLEGFVQQLGCSYLRHGYWFFLTGEIPRGKAAAAVDEKIVSRYGVAETRWERARRKRAGEGNAHYLRFERFFVILATSRGCFSEGEQRLLGDARENPIRLGGYSVSFRQGHVHVRIEQETYRALKAYFLELALHRTWEKLASEFYAVPFEPWAPVRQQLRNILRGVNRARKTAGFEPVPIKSLPFHRRIVRPFEPRRETFFEEKAA